MPQSPDRGRTLLVLFILIWVFLAPDNGPALISAPSLATARLARQRQALAVLNSTSWGDFAPRPVENPEHAPRFLNLTGFRKTDGYAWQDLDRFKDRCREWSRNVFPSPAGDDQWEHSPIQTTWQNATGTVYGEWARRPGAAVKQAVGFNLSDIAPAVSWPEKHVEWARNTTGDHGTIMLRLIEEDVGVEYEEKKPGIALHSASVAREVSALVTIQDKANQASSWNMRLFGVHWPSQGSILLTTTSEKFAGIFGLPHLAPDREFFESSQRLLNQTLDKALRKKERTRFTDTSNPWSSVVEGSDEPWALAPHCEYVMYLQLQPLDLRQTGLDSLDDGLAKRPTAVVDSLENELRHPTGAPIKVIPELRMSLVAWSPDCGFYLESKGPPHYHPADGQHLVGMKEEVFIYRAKVWMLAFAALLMAQIWLLKAQLKETNTPSTIGRVSFYTAGMMLLADGLVFAGASAWSLSATSTFLPCLAVTFAAFMSMVIEGSFLSEVYKILEQERRNQERGRERQHNANASNAPRVPPPPPPPPVEPRDGTLPRPVTAGPPRAASPPIIIPSDQDIDAEIAENLAAGAAAIPTAGALPAAPAGTPARPQARVTTFASISARFVLLGVMILFLTAAAASWPATIRSAYINMLAFLYLSLWLPQIWRNVQRNSRRAFAWRFMIGQSVLRLMPFAYFYLREDNILFAEPDWRAFAVLASWLWIQLWVLALQDILGPRFGIPRSWAPEAWEYHPVLREDNVEAGGLPIGLVGTSSNPTSPVAGRMRSWSMGSGGGEAREREKVREKRGTYLRSMDCAICKEILEVPVVRAGAEDPSGGGVAGVLARRAYMVTPCRHIYHTKCLEGWLRHRLVCPICREELPPL